MATLRELAAMNNRSVSSIAVIEVAEDLGISAKDCVKPYLTVSQDLSPESLIALLLETVQSLQRMSQTGNVGTCSTLGLETISFSINANDATEETAVEPTAEGLLRTEEWFNANESPIKANTDEEVFVTREEAFALVQRIEPEGAIIAGLNNDESTGWTLTVTGEKGTYEITDYEGWKTVKEEEGL